MSFYVTTPIYYVNAAPHLGHAYTTIAADVMARHHRQRGEEVFFLTGTDEHGEPVADAAHALGHRAAGARRPQRRALQGARAAARGDGNDFFIRTTDPQHEAVVQEVLTRVRDNGFVYKGTYEGWYCPRCADFKADNEIDEGNRCPIHHIELTREQEDNYFFKLSAFQERLERAVRRARGLRRAAHALQRGALVHPLGPARRAAHASQADVGRAACRGTTSTSSTCGSTRCSTTTRRSPTPRWRGSAPRELWPASYHLIAQGHPALSHRLLACAADGRRDRAAGARLRPRLSADGRREDEQVAGQRARPLRRDRALRRGRPALLSAARGALRPGRLGLHGLLRAALRERAGQRARQPRQPHASACSCATATAQCRRRASWTRALAADFAGLRRARRSARRPRRAHARARGDLAARAGA